MTATRAGVKQAKGPKMCLVHSRAQNLYGGARLRRHRWIFCTSLLAQPTWLVTLCSDDTPQISV